MFSYKDFWIITLIVLLVVYTLGKSKHLISHKYPHNKWPNLSSWVGKHFPSPTGKINHQAYSCRRDLSLSAPRWPNWGTPWHTLNVTALWDWGVQGEPLIGPPLCREAQAARVAELIFPSLACLITCTQYKLISAPNGKKMERQMERNLDRFLSI